MKKKYLYIGITAFCVVAASIMLFFVLYNAGSIISALGKIASALMPVIYGIVLAYLLLPLYNWIFNGLYGKFSQKMKKEKSARYTAKTLATTISMLFAFIVVGGLLLLVVPQVISSVYAIVPTLPDTIRSMRDWVTDAFADHQFVQELIKSALNSAENTIRNFATSDNFMNMAPEIISSAALVVGFLIDIAKNIIIGIIIAIYILNSTKLFAAQAKKLTYSIFKVKTANSIIHNFRYTHKMIGGFINGRLLDSLIVGVVCALCMAIFRMPYPVLIGVVVGVTNIIPFFGPFIGAIPSALLILTVDPKKALWFVVFIIILQQLDGNLLCPKIASNMTGLSSFWVMFALLLFGGLFGVWGLILGVPIFAVVKTLFAETVNKKLKKKNMPVSTLTYLTTGYVEPIEIVDVSGDYEDSASDAEDDEGEIPESSFIKKIAAKFTKKSKK
ncbi:MAG: AI-2E family transporter [Clostridia bacterium]|nr:AI-2E family transporter [Clostridia bacterium]